MAKRIRIDEIGDFASSQYEQLLRSTVFKTDKRLKEESPVDTGRFRLSWAIGQNQQINYDAGSQSSPSGVNPPRRLNYQQEVLGNVYHISNSLPYAERLAYQAWSKQAPNPGWPDRIAAEMAKWARSEADRIGRSA